MWADGTFSSNTAPLMGSLDDCARRASDLGYDALSLTVKDPNERDWVRMLAFLPVCAELGGAKLIIGAIRGWTRDAGGRDVYGSLFRASLEEILNQAEPLGVPVALEAISRMDSDAYCSVAETADFIRSFHSSALRLQLDSIHLHTNGETQFCEEILRAGELIGQVDISDVGRMAPDGDHFDFPKLIQALKEIHYQDYLVFEYRAAPPEYAAKAGLDYIRSLL